MFSDRLLSKMYSWTHPSKPSNNEYRKLRAELKDCPITSWLNGRKQIYKISYDLLEKFRNCPDFLAVGYSLNCHIKANDTYLHLLSVLPKGNVKRTYYAFETDYDERMKENS